MLIPPSAEPTEKTFLPTAEQFLQVNLVFEPLPAAAQNPGPTMARPTTSSVGRRPVTAADAAKEPPRYDGAPTTGVSTFVACCDDGTKNTVQTMSTTTCTCTYKMASVERATRRGKTRTGGRRSCTFMAWVCFAATLMMADVVRAVFAPADRTALKAAVGTCTSSGCTGGCLGETADGSCPILAASNVPGTGNPYGVIGDWDVSAVTNMYQSKCTLPLPLSVATPSAVVYFEYTTTRVSSDHTSHAFCYVCFVFYETVLFVVICGGLVFLFLCCTLSCSVFWCICVQSGRVEMEYGGGDNYGTH